MRPRLAVDVALELALDAVVADRGGGVKRVGHVLLRDSGDDAVGSLRGMVRPDAGVAVGL